MVAWGVEGQDGRRRGGTERCMLWSGSEGGVKGERGADVRRGAAGTRRGGRGCGRGVLWSGRWDRECCGGVAGAW